MNSKRRLTLPISTMCFAILLAALIIVSLLGALRPVRAQTPTAEKVIYNFAPATGDNPTGVIRDSVGNLYVATRSGGNNQVCAGGCGNVLEVSASGQPTVLYAFSSFGSDRSGPGANGVLRDAQGNLYTGTSYGGRNLLYGSVFKLTPSGKIGFLHSFGGGEDGYTPSGALTLDSGGNIYGTTSFGGGTGCTPEPGCGIVYKITRSGVEAVLYSFTGGTDGRLPQGGAILDGAGNLYGTAALGGDLTCAPLQGIGCGTVWKLDTSGNFSVLYSFTGGTDGLEPFAGLVMDDSGNLYGTAIGGGDLSCSAGGGFGCGVVFEIDFSGNFTVLHAFNSDSGDGQFPEGTLLRDSSGNLYGTTVQGGDQSCTAGCGIVFKLDPSNNETVLHMFTGGTTDGGAPTSGALVPDGKGNLYGTTVIGGLANTGVIFKVQTQ